MFSAIYLQTLVKQVTCCFPPPLLTSIRPVSVKATEPLFLIMCPKTFQLLFPIGMVCGIINPRVFLEIKPKWAVSNSVCRHQHQQTAWEIYMPLFLLRLVLIRWNLSISTRQWNRESNLYCLNLQPTQTLLSKWTETVVVSAKQRDSITKAIENSNRGFVNELAVY